MHMKGILLAGSRNISCLDRQSSLPEMTLCMAATHDKLEMPPGRPVSIFWGAQEAYACGSLSQEARGCMHNEEHTAAKQELALWICV